jgi:RNA polymerase sigma-70 factor, ECF subfamily
MKDPNVIPIEDNIATDSMLLRAALDNDQAAWQRLVETYGGQVYRWARNDGLQDSDAAEIANQVFALVARALPDFHHSRESDTFGGWLRRITQNAIADWRRAQQRQPCPAAGGSDNQRLLEDQAILAAVSSTRRPEPSPEQAAVERVRAGTRPDVWRMFWLLSVEGMTPDEVAAKCGVSVNAVYLAKYRTAKRIRRELANGGQSSVGGNDHGIGEQMS